MVKLIPQVNWYHVVQNLHINHIVAIWVAQDAQANKNYQPGAESKDWT